MFVTFIKAVSIYNCLQHQFSRCGINDPPLPFLLPVPSPPASTCRQRAAGCVTARLSLFALPDTPSPLHLLDWFLFVKNSLLIFYVCDPLGLWDNLKEYERSKRDVLRQILYGDVATECSTRHALPVREVWIQVWRRQRNVHKGLIRMLPQFNPMADLPIIMKIHLVKISRRRRFCHYLF